MKQVDREKNIITYSDDKLSCKKVIYGEYSDTADITFIMEDTIEKVTEKTLSTEVVGFYYGVPDVDDIEEYIGRLKAEFAMGEHKEDYDLEEICPYCSHVNQIKWDETSRRIKCQNCGEEILLCSLCNMDEVECSKCPY